MKGGRNDERKLKENTIRRQMMAMLQIMTLGVSQCSPRKLSHCQSSVSPS